MNAVSHFVTECPACRSSFRVSAEHLGRTATCPSCRGAFVVTPRVSAPIAPRVAPQSVGLHCRLCGTRMHASLREVGKLKSCPDCGSKTRVPPPERPKGPNIPAAMEGEQYALWDDPVQPWGTELAAREAKLIPVRCELCDTLMYAAAEQVGARIPCPDCGLESLVKQPTAPPPQGPQPVKSGREYPLDSDALHASVMPAAELPIYSRMVEDDSPRNKEEREKQIRLAATNRRSRPQMPKRPMLTGYTRFACGPGIIARWLTISAALVAAIMLGVFAGSLIFDGYGALAGLPLLCAAASIAALALGAAAACAITIVTESSEGNDHMQSWPSTNPIDWMGECVYLLTTFSAAAIPGWLLGKLSLAEPVEMLAFAAGSLWLCLPITLLSTLEASSPWSLVMPGVVAGVFQHAGSWMLFYLISGLGFAAVIAGVLLLGAFGGLAVILAVPVVAAAAGLYFRLVGRLAWKIREDEE